MRHFFLIGLVAACVVLSGVRSAESAIAGLERVASDLSSPLFVTHAPGDRDRLFIVERGSPANSDDATASIRILNLNTGLLNPTSFLTIPDVENKREGGLLGLAFHPDYQNNGKFYVYLTAQDSIPNTAFSSYIREYTVSGDPNVANSTFTPVLTFGQASRSHNAGWMGFSPNDGYLYIASGDGGGANDSGPGHTPDTGNAQDLTDNLLGKMLRLDVDGADDFPDDDTRKYAIPASNPFVGVPGDDEIWSYGLRNPFRDSFDRLTGDLWITDVGQNRHEEVNFQPGDSSGGENYGWRLREGRGATRSGGVGGPRPPGNVDPVYDYDRDPNPLGGRQVSGGYVYRGPDPSLQGTFFFADGIGDGDGNHWTFDPADPFGTIENIDSLLTPDVGSAQYPVSFGEDADGNLYIAYLLSGEVYRIATDELLPGDYDADGDVDDDDYLEWKTAFGTSDALPDGNDNGIVDAADYTVWRDNLGRSVHDLNGAAATAAGDSAIPEPAAVVLFAQLAGLMLLGRRQHDKVE